MREPVKSLLIWLTLPFSVSWGCSPRSSEDGVLPEVRRASEFSQTDVVAHTQVPLTQGRNNVYCGTFQLAWNELQDGVVGGPILLEGAPLLADTLNRQTFTAQQLSPETYIAMAGVVKAGIVDRINQILATRFGETFRQPDSSLGPNAYVAFAYLQKSLSFPERFDQLEDAIVFHSSGGNVQVPAFGIEQLERGTERGNRLRNQVHVLDYTGPDDFIVRLRTKSDRDDLVLAKVAPGESLGVTISAVRQRIKDQGSKYEGPTRLNDGNRLAIPILQFAIERDYDELVLRDLQNPGFSQHFIAVARQTIRFRLDESGARLSSDAFVGIEKSVDDHGGQFIFDRPFLVMLSEGPLAEPYFAMWVENAEVLLQER